jgi:hypothetical protein
VDPVSISTVSLYQICGLKEEKINKKKKIKGIIAKEKKRVKKKK